MTRDSRPVTTPPVLSKNCGGKEGIFSMAADRPAAARWDCLSCQTMNSPEAVECSNCGEAKGWTPPEQSAALITGQEPCEACRATGLWADDRQCSSCDGTGEVRVVADRCVNDPEILVGALKGRITELEAEAAWWKSRFDTLADRIRSIDLPEPGDHDCCWIGDPCPIHNPVKA